MAFIWQKNKIIINKKKTDACQNDICENSQLYKYNFSVAMSQFTVQKTNHFLHNVIKSKSMMKLCLQKKMH